MCLDFYGVISVAMEHIVEQDLSRWRRFPKIRVAPHMRGAEVARDLREGGSGPGSGSPKSPRLVLRKCANCLSPQSERVVGARTEGR